MVRVMAVLPRQGVVAGLDGVQTLQVMNGLKTIDHRDSPNDNLPNYLFVHTIRYEWLDIVVVGRNLIDAGDGTDAYQGS